MTDAPKHPLAVLSSFSDQVRQTLRLDAFVNVITGLGGRRDKSTLGRPMPFATLQPAELDWLYHGSDLPATIVEALVDDAMGQGIYTGDPALDHALLRWGLIDKVAEAWIWGRLYGLGAVIVGTTDRLGAPKDPLDWSRLRPGDLSFLMVADGTELQVATRVTDRRSSAYDEPRTYRFQGSQSAEASTSKDSLQGQEIHASRMILFGGARTASRVKMRNQDRDLSVLQRPYEVLRDVDGTWRSVMLLLQDMSQAVFKIKGLQSMITDGHAQVAMDRMQLVDMARSVARAVVIDAEGESFEHVGAANVAAIDPLVIRTFVRLAAAAKMPVTRLMGMSPAGLNATGDSDLRMWYKSVQNARIAHTPQVLKLVRLVALTSDDVAGVPESIKWPSLWEPTDTERADLELKRAQTAQIRVTVGMSTSDEERLLWVRGADPEDVLDMTDTSDPAAEAMGDVYPAPGEIWLDTEDGHRSEVTAVHSGRVFYLDLDGPRPDRQFTLKLVSFLERNRKIPDGTPPAPPPAPTPAPEPSPPPADA